MRAVLAVLALAAPLNAFAECGPLSSYRDVLKCAVEHGPAMQRSRKDVAIARANEDAASQRVNPEFSSKSVFGTGTTRSDRDVELTLAHTFELGGKRDARALKARAESEAAAVRSESSRDDTFIRTLVLLYRARHLKKQFDIVASSLATFRTIQKQFSNRSRLSPEQEVSANVYELATSDYELKRSAIVAELEEIKRDLRLALGTPLEPTEKLLPPEKINWPSLESTGQGLVQSPAYRLADAEFHASQANLESERSLAWPDLKLGPTYQNQLQGSENSAMWGFSLSTALPLFQANGAGKAAAAEGVERASLSLRIAQEETSSDRAAQVAIYRDSVESLKRLPPGDKEESRARRMHALFSRGVVPSSLVVEAQRQLLEFTKSKQEQELRALSALTKVYSIDGRLLGLEL